MTWNTALTKLRDILAELYPTYESYHRVAVEAGLPSGDIPSRGKPKDIWHDILMEAQKRGQVKTIVTVARVDYPEDEGLTGIFELLGSDEWLTFPSITSERSSKQDKTRTNIGGSSTEAKPSRKSPEAASSTPFCVEATVQPEHFYNRESEVRDALRRLRASQNIEVIGARRIGKTWFLKHLSCPTTLDQNGMDPLRNIFVYIDCQQRSIQQEKPLVYKTMMERIVSAAGRRAGIDLEPELRDGSVGEAAFERFLRGMSRRGLRTVLLLDEFEAMVQNRNLNTGFFSHLRALWSADDVKVAYVTASCTDLVKLFSEQKALSDCPFFEIFRPIQLRLFDEQQSRHLVKDSLRKANASLPQELLELVLEMGDGHPFFLQMAGDRAFELAISGEELAENKRQAFIKAISAETSGHFKYWWNNLGEQEQYALAALPLLQKDHSYQSELERLRKHCLIAGRGGQDDYLSPLFERFVRRQKVTGLLQAGPLLVDQRRGEVLLRRKPLNLSVISQKLLACLVEQAGQVVSNEELWRAAWPKKPYETGEWLETKIRILRKALGDDGDCIVDKRGAGYMFQCPLE